MEKSATVIVSLIAPVSALGLFIWLGAEGRYQSIWGLVAIATMVECFASAGLIYSLRPDAAADFMASVCPGISDIYDGDPAKIIIWIFNFLEWIFVGLLAYYYIHNPLALVVW